MLLFQVNSKETSFTGTSGTLAWELEEQGVKVVKLFSTWISSFFLDSQVHLIIMWSVPYNLNIYNSYFGVGVVQLTTRFNQQMQMQKYFSHNRFTRDMLPYWYNQMISHKLGRTFQVTKDIKQARYVDVISLTH